MRCFKSFGFIAVGFENVIDSNILLIMGAHLKCQLMPVLPQPPLVKKSIGSFISIRASFSAFFENFKFFKFFRPENWFELEYILRIWDEISNKLFFSLSFGRCPQTSSEKFIFGYLDIFSHRNTISIFIWWYSRKWRGRPLWFIQMGCQPRLVLVLILLCDKLTRLILT